MNVILFESKRVRRIIINPSTHRKEKGIGIFLEHKK
jgi:hypothetical protein